MFVRIQWRSAVPLINLSLLGRPLFLVSVADVPVTGLGVIGTNSFLPALPEETTGLPAIDAAWLVILRAGMSSAVALQVREPANRFCRHQPALGSQTATDGCSHNAGGTCWSHQGTNPLSSNC